MMDQKQFDALLDQWIEDHKQEMIAERGRWVSRKSVGRGEVGAGRSRMRGGQGR